MAGENEMQSGDLTPHVQTYDRVIALLKWGAVACFVVAAIVIVLIAT